MKYAVLIVFGLLLAACTDKPEEAPVELTVIDEMSFDDFVEIETEAQPNASEAEFVPTESLELEGEDI